MTFTTHTLPKYTSNTAGTVVPTQIDGLYALPTKAHHDDRGFFVELGKIPNLNVVRNNPFIVKQINHAHSKQFVTRGFHAEDWNKLVTVTRGVCFVAIADVRKASPTYGTVVTTLLSHTDTLERDTPLVPSNIPAFSGSLFLPSGVANSVCVLSPTLDYLYAVDKLYEERDSKGDTAISLFDPTLSVSWPIPAESMILSQRDTDALFLEDIIANAKRA